MAERRKRRSRGKPTVMHTHMLNASLEEATAGMREILARQPLPDLSEIVPPGHHAQWYERYHGDGRVTFALGIIPDGCEYLTIAPNPAYAERTPEKLVATCHDGTPFLTARCSCGADFHFHASQFAAVPLDAEIGTHCQSCGKTLLLAPGAVQGAFAAMRRSGWIE